MGCCFFPRSLQGPAFPSGGQGDGAEVLEVGGAAVSMAPGPCNLPATGLFFCFCRRWTYVTNQMMLKEENK